MADPVVHITAGIPDSGTGNITTLGQTIAAQAAALAGQFGPLAQGSVTTAAPTYTTGTINPLSLDGAGNLRTLISNASLTVSGTVTSNQGGAPWSQNLTQFGGNAVVTGTGIGGAGIPRVTVSSDSSLAATQSGTWNINNISGTVSLPTGAATAAKQPALGTSGVPSADVITVQGIGGGTAQPVSGTVTVTQGTAANLNATVTGTVSATQSGSWTVQQGTPPWTVGGDTASGATDANNPVKIGGLARTSNPGAVVNGQRVNAIFDKLGKQVVVGALRDVKGVQKTSITTNSETTVVTAGAAGVVNDVYAIVVTNKSATSVWVDFRDSTAGTVRMTMAAPAGDTRGFTVSVDSAMVQALAANNWTATVSSAVTSIEITMLYVSNL